MDEKALSRNVLMWIAAIFVVIALSYLLFSGTGGRTQGVTTLQGMHICLPHLDTSGPQTLECAFGLSTEEGNYAMDLSALDSTDVANLNIGEIIEVTGEVTAREDLDSDDRLLIYDIEGLIKVESFSKNPITTSDEHTVTGEELIFERPSDFGLAVSNDQVLVESVIPPCDEGFDYCLYYNRDTYADTNFESAGLRIEKRTDLANQQVCLSTPPEGYNNLSGEFRTAGTYATSVFSPIGSAAAGHNARGSVYRLAFEEECYEFETRIAVSQFENFEAGTTQEFSESDRQAMNDKLNSLLQKIRFTDRKDEVIFP